MRVLIIGSTGVIGSQLSVTLQKEGNEVFGASRRIDSNNRNFRAIDLANTAGAIETISNLPKMDAVVISAGMTGLRECEKDPNLSRIVNVTSQVEIAKWFVISGCPRVIFLSSNRVFDGRTENVKSDAEYSPTTEYGRQKAQAEEQILSLGEATRVIRFTKVLSASSKLLVDWIAKIKVTQPVSAFTDVCISPITKEHACAVIKNVLLGRSEPIVQASSTDEISYFEMACLIAEQLGVDKSIVHKQTASDVGETALMHSSLESSELNSIEPMSSLSAVRQVFKEMV
jgi:dTDP-4-dehydrorhamnose reductase